MIKAQSNINQVVSNLLGKLQSFQKGGQGFDSALREVATTMRAEMTNRIHSEGKKADNSDIGQYSTTPLYVSTTANPGRSFGRPIGKTGKSKFETGKKAGQDHASRYFEGGYNQFKTAIGRNQLGKVNLSLSGQLSNQFQIIALADGYGIGWVDTEKRERADHLEKKYGKVWGLTEEEKQLSKKIIETHLNNAFSA